MHTLLRLACRSGLIAELEDSQCEADGGEQHAMAGTPQPEASVGGVLRGPEPPVALSTTSAHPWINGPLHGVLSPTTQSSTISIAVPWLLD